MTTGTVYVGVDIACASAQVAWLLEDGTTGQQSIQQSPEGQLALIRQLQQLAPAEQTRVVMEATGNYWLALALALHEAGVEVSVLNPSQAKHFAKVCLKRAKSDPVDAALLAQFAQRMQPARWNPPPAICAQLQQVLTRRQQVVDMHTAELNHLHALRHLPGALPSILTEVQDHLALLSARINTLNQQLEQLVSGQHEWHTAFRHLCSIPGVGTLGAATLLTATHCFARCETPEQAAAFAGLVPYVRQSGSSLRAQAHIGGGEPHLRHVLYMCALAAVRCTPGLRLFYQRLLAQGKAKKVALCAVARKLVHIAWALVVHDCDFDPAHRLPS